jgi:hypothetical protein
MINPPALATNFRRLLIFLPAQGRGMTVGSLWQEVSRIRPLAKVRLGQIRVKGSQSSNGGYTTAPNRWPMPAVMAMASAPQKVTLPAPIQIFAPPTRAARPPMIARKTKELAATTGTK